MGYVAKHKTPRSSRYSPSQLNSMRRALRPERPEGDDWKALRRSVIERDRFTCQWCACIVFDTSQAGDYGAQVDHIRPLARGGHPTDLGNLETLCKKCNTQKSSSYRGSAGVRY
jgi:5-methylcytosine-specific restriction endonuclease McrA